MRAKSNKPLVPPKNTIGLSASVACELIKICFRILKLNKLSAFYREFHLIWFSGHKEILNFVRYVVLKSLASKF